jgi:hypothetical protein
MVPEDEFGPLPKMEPKCAPDEVLAGFGAVYRERKKDRKMKVKSSTEDRPQIQANRPQPTDIDSRPTAQDSQDKGPLQLNDTCTER